MPDSFTIVGLGEALYDVFPDETRLGGAPLNAAVHAHQLGNKGVMVSRVGKDELGRRIAAELRARGMTADYVQVDSERPTGTVNVRFDSEGQPEYEIVRGVAWDAIEFTPELEAPAEGCDAVCFGTLAQREQRSRETIARFLGAAERAVRLLDVNLRQDFYSREIIEGSCAAATAVKLNKAELDELARMLDLGGGPDEAARALLERFDLEWVALTSGPLGTKVCTGEGWFEAEAVPADEKDADPVGAGDAAAAALLHGVVRGWDWKRTLTLANRLGAFVASRRGACPPLDEDILELR